MKPRSSRVLKPSEPSTRLIGVSWNPGSNRKLVPSVVPSDSQRPRPFRTCWWVDVEDEPVVVQPRPGDPSFAGGIKQQLRRESVDPDREQVAIEAVVHVEHHSFANDIEQLGRSTINRFGHIDNHPGSGLGAVGEPDGFAGRFGRGDHPDTVRAGSQLIDVRRFCARFKVEHGCASNGSVRYPQS